MTISSHLLPPGEYRVAEIFGPVLQGEGPFAGRPCYFIRLGGCDYRCVWCDSMHAVLPEKVAELPIMTAAEITAKLHELPGKFHRVIISGGNPALYDLSPLLEALQDEDRDVEVNIETQGTFYTPSLTYVDHVTVSPKPPSSGMKTSLKTLQNFVWNMDRNAVEWDLKIVVFTQFDLEFAIETATLLTVDRLYISIGTHATDTRDSLVETYKWWTDKVLALGVQPFDLIILPQLHVVVHGHKLGV